MVALVVETYNAERLRAEGMLQRDKMRDALRRLERKIKATEGYGGAGGARIPRWRWSIYAP
ncbi:hypothetical protein [Rhodospirillum rubrum]|nr:hypothetical protein [Rhodospirillum rubrum]